MVFNRDFYVFMLPYSFLLLLFIYSFSLLFLRCTLGLFLLFGRPTAHERSLKIVNVPNGMKISHNSLLKSGLLYSFPCMIDSPNRIQRTWRGLGLRPSAATKKFFL